MRWLLGARRLRELGVLGINRRNADCILGRNPRSVFPVVDDKLRMQSLCESIGVPTPTLLGVVERHSQLRHLDALTQSGDMVVKPARGSGGRGVMVLAGRDAGGFRRHDGSVTPAENIRQHFCSILAGLYSLGGRPDRAIIQQRVRLHADFEPIAFQGIPDVRVVLYRGEPAMAMLRLPTRESGGRANLHQGGIGVGVDLSTGRTIYAVRDGHPITVHPDTGANLIDRPVPGWPQVLTMARRTAEAVGLGYLGVDIVIDAESGPLLLEANARPGLAIQFANGIGLRTRLNAIDAATPAAVSEPRVAAAA